MLPGHLYMYYSVNNCGCSCFHFSNAGMVDCAASVYRNGGIAPFFRGAIALVVRGVLVNAVVFWSYEKIFKGLEHTAQK